ncbi:MAG: DUF1638 domain-containing protein [Coriobacteriia bacterium]|nr:DUF1638 domain-containing protein [Coriobacteriia bacterium]
MFIKFICCDVFARIACALVAESPHIIDLEFVPMLSHVEPDKLRLELQERINKAVDGSNRVYDALILGFGLCGNVTIGLACPIPMIIPRVHDCCTLFMGSKERFLEEFGDRLSSRWLTTGYYERTYSRNSGYPMLDQQANYKTSIEYMNFLEQYDEETADYLWQTMHPIIEMKEAVYINIDGYEHPNAYPDYVKLMSRQEVDVVTVNGDVSMLKALVNGDWDNERFLTVNPGNKVVGVYDMDEVIKEA